MSDDVSTEEKVMKKTGLVMILAAAALTGCQSAHMQARQVCDSYGWESARCGYAQRAADRQQAHSAAMMRQGVESMSNAYQPVETPTTCWASGSFVQCY